MYQPRRVADPIAPAGPADRAPQLTHSPRYAAPSVADTFFAKGSIALAIVTATATAGVVVAGGSADPAAAVGTAAAPLSAQATVASALPAAPLATRTLTADQLSAPAFGTAKTAAKGLARELVSRTPMYAKASVNVRKQPDAKAKLLGSLERGARVNATAEIDGKYRRVQYGKGYGWVLKSSLSDAAPARETGSTQAAGTGGPAGTTWDKCSRGSKVERRLRKDTVHIYRSVCALFPAVNSYGGWRAGGLPFHKNGRALDIMLTPHAESALGHRIAKYLIAHAKAFRIDHIIFEQHIWTPRTPRWRKMADRGSLNANHFNHVHVAIRP